MEVQKIEKEAQNKREEQEQQFNKLMEEYAKRKLRPRVEEISHYMDLTKKTLDQLYEDLYQKQSGLSSNNRLFLQAFTKEYIYSLFKKKYK